MATDVQGKRNIAANIHRAMQAAGMSQADIARATGENRMTISNIVRGIKMPGAALLGRVAESLGVSTDALLADPPKKVAAAQK